MGTQTDVERGREDEERPEIGEEIDVDDVEALAAVAALDLEAALVYELVADTVEAVELADMLRGFAADHRRHVEDLERIIEEESGARPERDERGGILYALASTMGQLDDDAAIEALIANERLTNGTYETAQWVVALPQARAVLERNFADEQRHLTSLVAYQEGVDDEG